MKQKLLFLLLCCLWLATFEPALAQDPETNDANIINWRELQTERFVIVYAESIGPDEATSNCECGLDEAQLYADFADQIHDDLAVIFGVSLDTKINLRLFPTEESYYQVNPLAEVLTGVIAHALNSREEIAIALPRTKQLPQDELVNNIRHELAHIFASLISDGKMTSGFQEGVAQYVEVPTERSNAEPALLQQAYEQGRLLTWAELDEARRVYSDPQVAYPQSLSMVAFLVDRYGFLTFIDFMAAHSTEPGYRTALEATYNKSANVLEEEWLAYLPEYFESRWQINALYAYDLSRVTRLVDEGAYTDAQAELVEIVELLDTTDQAENAVEARRLLEKTEQGQAAGQLIADTRTALLRNDYAATIATGQAAIAAYQQLGNPNRISEIETYISRATIGQQALAELNEGANMLTSFRFFEAEQKIYDATLKLQSLDNQTAAQQGQQLLQQSAGQQSWLAYAMLAVGGLLLLFNGASRLFYWLTASPLEAEFT